MVVSLGSRLAVITADVIVLAATWHKTLGTVREAKRLQIQMPLSTVLIRDGMHICLEFAHRYYEL